MQESKCRRLGESAWRELLGGFARGEESVSAFCRREGLKENTFYRWRARLAHGSQAPQGGDWPVERGQPGGRLMPRFVDLGALSAGSAAEAGRLELKLDLGAGMVLHVVRG